MTFVVTLPISSPLTLYHIDIFCCPCLIWANRTKTVSLHHSPGGGEEAEKIHWSELPVYNPNVAFDFTHNSVARAPKTCWHSASLPEGESSLNQAAVLLKPIWDAEVPKLSEMFFHVVPRFVPVLLLYNRGWVVSFFLQNDKKQRVSQMETDWHYQEQTSSPGIVTEGIILKVFPLSRTTSKSFFLSRRFPPGAVTCRKETITCSACRVTDIYNKANQLQQK